MITQKRDIDFNQSDCFLLARLLSAPWKLDGKHQTCIASTSVCLTDILLNFALTQRSSHYLPKNC